MKKGSIKKLVAALLALVIVFSFVGCAKINYVANGTIQAIKEVQDGSYQTGGALGALQSAGTSEDGEASGDEDPAVIETLQPNTYGGVDYTYAELFEHKEIYMSFTLPLRSGDWLTCRIPLALIILAGGIVGGLVIMALKEGEYRFLTKRGCYYQDDGDMVLEIREFGKKLAKSVRKKPAAEAAGAGAPDEAADGVPVMPEVKASMEESRQEAEKK